MTDKCSTHLPTPNNQPRSVALEVETIMPECVLPRIEGKPKLTDQVNQILLKQYYDTGEAVDNSIMAPHYPWCSNKGSIFKGKEILPNANI